MGIDFVENYKNLSDYEVILLINNGNYDLLQVILQRYYPVVLYYAKKYCSVDYYEDAIQEGNLALFSAVKKFDKEKSSFSTFATLCIKRAMLSVIKTKQRKKTIPDELMSSIEDCHIIDVNSPEALFIERENFETLKSDIRLELSGLEYKVLQLFLSGKDYSEIGSVLKISEKSVGNALSRIRKKLKNK